MRALCVVFAFLLVHWGSGQVLTVQPKADIFYSTPLVGSNSSGTSESKYGCQGNGATLSNLTLWANALYIRGMAVSLTDGSNVTYGCVNVTGPGQTSSGGCNSNDTRSQSFVFQPGETVTSLTLWAGYSPQQEANQRGGAVSFNTSQGRTFDFGMTAARNNPVTAALGSGIPCGVATRAGADIDALGFVFLRNVTSSVLTGVTYEGISTTQAGGSGLDSNATVNLLSERVYNNSGNSSALVATFASMEPTEQSATWSTTSGVDSYLTSQVNAGLPLPATNSSAIDSPTWFIGSPAAYNRSLTSDVQQSWNYTVNVQPGGISRVAATAVDSFLTTSFSGNLNVTLDSGAVLTIPVTGTYEGESTSPVNISTTVLQAGRNATADPASSGGSNNTLAWVLGVVLGVLGGLLLAALIAWAVVLIMRRRRREAAQPSPKKPPSPFFVGGGKWSQFNGDKGAPVAGKDVEMGSGTQPGKEEMSPDKKDQIKTVMGVPVHGKSGTGSSQEAGSQGLPESEGAFILPYNAFRRLRLDNIRHSLGMAPEEQKVENGVEHEAAGSSSPLQNTPEELSGPPSGASTPRVLSTSLLSPSHLPSGPATSGHNTDEDDKSETGAAEGLTVPSPMPYRPRSPRLARLSGGGPRADKGGNSRLKDRVAAIMKQSRVAAPALPEAASPREGAVRSTAASVQISREDTSVFKRLGSSISNFTSRKREGASEGSSSLLARPIEASPATKAAPPVLPAATSKPVTPRASNPAQSSKVIQYEDVDLKLGEGYQTPAAAKSVQKDAVDVDGERIQLGKKYHTQGRNE